MNDPIWDESNEGDLDPDLTDEWEGADFDESAGSRLVSVVRLVSFIVLVAFLFPSIYFMLR